MTRWTNDPVVIEHQVGARGRFTLRQASGEVSIKGVEGDRIRVRDKDGERGLTDVFTVETGSDFVDIRQTERFGLGSKLFGRNDSLDLTIEVPHGATVKIETASGDIDAADLSGDKHFRTASGDVRLSRLAGPVDVETVSGDIELEGQAPVDLKVKSVSGDIKVRVPKLRRLDMGTTSGDLWLDAELSGEGPFALRSISGDATIVGRNGFRVEAETITGDLSSDQPGKRESMPGRKVLIVGRPGPTLQFRSVSGDFRVAQPRDKAPESIPMPPQAPEAPAPPKALGSAGSTPDLAESSLEILRQLERGEISVAEAGERLGQLDGAVR